jgi:hypothetical protein
MDGDRSRRWLVLVRDSIVKTLAPDDPAVGAVPGDVFGVDSSGHVLSIRGSGADQLSREVSRLRNVAILSSRRGAKPDTILELRGYDQHVRFNAARSFSIHTMLMGSAEEQVQLFEDGWITSSVLSRTTSNGESPMATSSADQTFPGKRHAPMRLRSVPIPTRRGQIDWRQSGEAVAAHLRETFSLRDRGGRRSPTPRYDLVDRSGRLIGQLAMPDSERVVGFGPRSVYIVTTDGDGFQRLRRHPWP